MTSLVPLRRCLPSLVRRLCSGWGGVGVGVAAGVVCAAGAAVCLAGFVVGNGAGSLRRADDRRAGHVALLPGAANAAVRLGDHLLESGPAVHGGGVALPCAAAAGHSLERVVRLPGGLGVVRIRGQPRVRPRHGRQPRLHATRLPAAVATGLGHRSVGDQFRRVPVPLPHSPWPGISGVRNRRGCGASPGRA